jgi:hypothetical protein
MKQGATDTPPLATHHPKLHQNIRKPKKFMQIILGEMKKIHTNFELMELRGVDVSFISANYLGGILGVHPPPPLHV